MPTNAGWSLLFIAWVVALAAALGALFIGEILGQTPCFLCWHQRAFMFPLAIVLGIAALSDGHEVVRYALPLAAIGAAIAGYHSLLYSGLVPEPIVPCSATGPSCSGAGMVIGGVPLPYLSFLSFILIAALLVAFRRRSS